MPLKQAEYARTKEALLIYGPWGSGKSVTWASIAQQYRETDTPGKFYVLSTEPERAERVAEGFPGTYENTEIIPVRNFDETEDKADKLLDIATPEDWLAVDSVGNLKTWVRNDWFRHHRNGKTWKQFQADGGTAKDVTSSQWTQMNLILREMVVDKFFYFPGHRLFTAQSEPTNTDGAWADKGIIKQTFGPFGVKAVADEIFVQNCHTVLLLAMEEPGERWSMTTVKDSTGHKYLKEEPVERGFDLESGKVLTPFVSTYLCSVAGWRIV